MHVLSLRIDLRVIDSSSLKAKRSVVQSIVRTLDGWKAVAAAEVDAHELWQRTVIGVSVVGGNVGHVEDVADSVERFVWARPDVEVIEIERQWAEELNGERV